MAWNEESGHESAPEQEAQTVLASGIRKGPRTYGSGLDYRASRRLERLVDRKNVTVTGSTVESFWKDLEAENKDLRVRPNQRWDDHMHFFSREDWAKMEKNNESIETRHPHTIAYRRYLAQKEPVSSFRKWIVFFVIGMAIGLMGFFMFETIQYLSHHRRDLLTHFYKKARDEKNGAKYLLAFLLWGTSGVALAALSMLLVRWCPPAGGSGVTDVMAYLNGVFFKKVFNVKTLLAKSISCICAVSSGLPVGPEGPMIHIGAILGAGIGSGRSKSLKFSFNTFFSQIRNPKDQRDAITAGAAAGVAVAFGAPIGGLLFVSEEIATHWHPSLTPLIFSCSLVATFTYGILASQYDGYSPRHETSFGGLLDEATILFETLTDRHMYARDILVAGVVGGICGMAATIFTKLNVQFAKARIKASSRRKAFEPVLLLLLYLAVSFVAPSVMSCTDLPVEDNSTDPEASSDEVLSLYLTAPCGNETQFNSAASLFWNPGESTIKLLFRKHSPFDWQALALFGVLYFFFSCMSCGMQISSGIVIPMLVTGGTIGRLCGRFVNNYIDSTQHEGVFAIIGAAGYFAGISKLTASLAVIMIELTNEKRILLPIMISILVSKLFTDQFTHSLYHRLLELRNVPFLDASEVENLTHRHMTCFTASDICTTRVICLKPTETVEGLRNVLRSCNHNGFPVVDSETGLHFLGLVSRPQLHTLLWNLEEGWDEQTECVMPERMDPAWGLLAKTEEAHFVRNELVPPCILGDESPLKSIQVNLLHHTDSSALTVNPGVSVTVVYELFTSLGLRHLTVVNERGVVVGIVTRKDLLPCRLQRRMQLSHSTQPDDPILEAHLDSEDEDWVVFDSRKQTQEDYF